MSSAITFPKISIIISTYNGAKYIAATIGSILNQTWQNWELIIIDDGSDDKTTEVIAGFKDRRIQLHVAGRIGINGKVKNIGLSKASGELIAFIDHDDLWAAEKLERQVAVLQQYPAAGFSLTGGYNFSEPGQPVEYFYNQREGIKYDNIFIACFQSEVAGFTQTLLLRRECIPVSGIFKETTSFSDVDFIVNLARHFKAVIIYEPLVYRRVHTGNYNQSNWEKSNYEGIEIIETYKKFLPPGIVSDALFRLYINFGEQYLQHRFRGKAINSFLKAWKQTPLSIIPVKKIVKAILYRLEK